MIYLSSMEMYGTMKDENVTEDKIGKIEILNTRSSYSEGKRIAELYCYSYFSEYNVPVKMCRLAQTFGPGISKNETRVFNRIPEGIKGDKILEKIALAGKSDRLHEFVTSDISNSKPGINYFIEVKTNEKTPVFNKK